jgi:hypothetical protein
MDDWKLSVPRGWHDIVEKMLADIDAAAGASTYSIFQIKEKFGRLECYLSWSDGVEAEIKKQASEIIDKTRRTSLTQCQFCESFGELKKLPQGLHATVCATHEAKIRRGEYV